MSIEKKIENLFDHLKGEYGHSWFNARDFPLTVKLTRRLNFPPVTLDSSDAGVVGSEFMSGIEVFLKAKGIQGIRPAPQPQEFNLFSPGTWTRALAEIFVPEKIERVKDFLPGILSEIEMILPESNLDFKSKIYLMAEAICLLRDSGVLPHVIAEHVLKK